VTNAKDSPIKTTGTFDFSGGVDSLKTPTVFQFEDNPDGLTKQELAWLVNGTMRDGALSPRDPWVKKGWINKSLPPQIIPGTPQQTIPQPNLPPVQTPNEQGFLAQSSTLAVPAVGSSVNVVFSFGEYVGNVGDVIQLTAVVSGGPSPYNVGTFLVTSFSNLNIGLQTVTSAYAGTTLNNIVGFDLFIQTIGPGLPQPPIVIPAGPPTAISTQPFFQGGILYTPPTGTPYIICVIGGHVVQVDPDFNYDPIDLSDTWGLYLPITPRSYFCQAATYLVIQAGDYNAVTGIGTLPLFWNGTSLVQSNGLTGITVVGTPVSNFYNLTLAQPWSPVEPSQGTVFPTSVMTLTAPYPGNLYDNLTITGTNLAGNNTFRVLGIYGNSITVAAVVLSATPSSPITGDLVATLTTPPTESAPNPDTYSASVVIGNGFLSIPANTGAMIKLVTTGLYFGSVGDTVTLQNQTTTVTYGTFKVVSFNDTGQLVLQYITAGTPSYSGQKIYETSFIVSVVSSRAYSQNVVVDGWILQADGGTSNLTIPANDTGYIGKLYDICIATEVSTGATLGVFRYVAESAPVETWETLELGAGVAPGTIITNTTVKFSVYNFYTTASPQYIILANGQWTVPPVGSLVLLGVVFPQDYIYPFNAAPPTVGPAYPGNIGDTITLVEGTQTIGTFMVVAFDLTGDIVLRTLAATPSTSIGQIITGPIDVTLTITQVPAFIGSNISQLPAALAMVYYQDIIWYAQGDVVSGGDIVGGPSGTAANNYTDSVLCVTENPLAIGGDGFRIPIDGNITGMQWPSQDNAALGQGLLYIFTINGCCSLQVPANRQSWISMTASNPPQINVVLGGKRDSPGYGAVNDWCIVPINGDLYFQTIEPGITSIILAQRYFQQWGNIDISNNEQRLWDFTNTGLLSWISGIYFNKRMLMTALPQLTQYGTVHAALLPMDMTPIDTFEELSSPNFEGMHEGFSFFQLLTSGEFGGKQRAFAITLNPNSPGEIDLYETIPTNTIYFDSITTPQGVTKNIPIEWQAEFPAFTWGEEADPKELLGGMVYYDQIVGEVIFRMEWRPDFASCWTFWDEWKVCFEQSSLSVPSIKNPSPYPLTLPPGYSFHSLPKPPTVAQLETGFPAARAYQIQPRLTGIGQARIRGLLLHAQILKKNIYDV
jgi:hypothetical protein